MATKAATKTEKKEAETPTHRCAHKKVKVDSVFSRHSHGVVVAIDRREGYATLKNSVGRQWDIGLNILEWECSFADQFDSEETVSTTKAIEILQDSPMTSMTIVFHKKAKDDEVSSLLAKGQGSLSAKDWKAMVKKSTAGEERTMVGHHTGNFDVFKRLYFTEQVNERSKEPETRLVDTRTLKMVIVNRVKYTVK